MSPFKLGSRALTWENWVSEERVEPFAYVNMLSAEFGVGGTA